MRELRPLLGKREGVQPLFLLLYTELKKQMSRNTEGKDMFENWRRGAQTLPAYFSRERVSAQWRSNAPFFLFAIKSALAVAFSSQLLLWRPLAVRQGEETKASADAPLTH